MTRRLLLLLVLASCVLVARQASAAPEPGKRGSGIVVTEPQRSAGEQTEKVSRTVNIGANGEIELSNISGDITITRGSGTSAVIEAIKTARGASADESREILALVQVDIVERGTRAEARVRYPGGDELRRQNRRNLNVSVAFNIAAPEGTRIIAKSISGNIHARRAVRRSSIACFGPDLARRITGSGSRSCSRQYSSCATISGWNCQCRCQCAKSAYWIESGAKGDSSWPENASYKVTSSSTNTPSDQPSQTTWCVEMRKRCSCSAMCTMRARMRGPFARSKE